VFAYEKSRDIEGKEGVASYGDSRLSKDCTEGQTGMKVQVRK